MANRVGRPRTATDVARRKTSIIVSTDLQAWLDFRAASEGVSQSVAIEHAISEDKRRNLEDPDMAKRFEAFLYATGRDTSAERQSEAL